MVSDSVPFLASLDDSLRAVKQMIHFLPHVAFIQCFITTPEKQTRTLGSPPLQNERRILLGSPPQNPYLASLLFYFFVVVLFVVTVWGFIVVVRNGPSYVDPGWFSSRCP